jgi:hypothetical protein
MTDGGHESGPEPEPERDQRREGPRTTAAYVHEPDGPPSPAEGREEFGLRGWLLVAVLLVALVVVPVFILFIPSSRPLIAALGLTLRDAYLVLPLLPALVLGAVAVLTALGNRPA